MEQRYATDEFLDALYRDMAEDRPLSGVPEENLESEQKIRRSRLARVLALDRLEAMAEGCRAREMHTEKKDGYDVIRCEMTFLPKLTAPFWILRPERPNGRTVLYCHGHDSYGGKGAFLDYGQEDPYHKWMPLAMARRGYTVYIPELIGFGEVRRERFREEEQRWCYSNATALLNLGLNLAGLRVFQTQRLFRQMTEQWDAGETAIYGVSGGGLVDTFVGELEPGLKGIVISNYGASFASSTMAMHHCIDNYIPGLLSVGECCDIMALAAPTPLLLSNGIRDPIFPEQGVRETAEQVKKVYETAGYPERFWCELFDGGHEVSQDQVFPFLEFAFQTE